MSEAESQCFSCGQSFPDNQLIWDEWDDQWCRGCIDRWESLHQEDWATGQPLKHQTTCEDCGLKGYHHPNCPGEN